MAKALSVIYPVLKSGQGPELGEKVGQIYKTIGDPRANAVLKVRLSLSAVIL